MAVLLDDEVGRRLGVLLAESAGLDQSKVWDDWKASPMSGGKVMVGFNVVHILTEAEFNKLMRQASSA